MGDNMAAASPTPVDSGGGRGLSGVPVAAVLCICLTAFLFAVILLLCLRKILQKRGVSGPKLSCSCCDGCCVGGGGGECGWWGRDACVAAAERLDCKGPDTQACLDSVCPSKQVCRGWCGQVWSCYACYMMREQCRGVSCASLCPSCAACDCPDVRCCGQCCHCTCKPPECTHINCLCCELDCGDSSDA